MAVEMNALISAASVARIAPSNMMMIASVRMNTSR
jgi:hypothetical protein